MWGCKVDLKHAYFHLGVADKLKPFLRIQIGQEQWQFQAACFGLNCLPFLWSQVMKVPVKRWRSRGIQVWVYLDDILVVSQSKARLEKDMETVLKDLEESGLMLNHKKSQLVPSQVLPHLGFVINFKTGRLEIPQEKVRQVKKELGKLVTQSSMSCRKMAAILGTVRSFLTALPFLRAFTDQMVGFVNQAFTAGWNKALPIPMSLQEQVREVKQLIEGWQGRLFQGRCAVRNLHADSSDHAWGGVDLTSGQCVQEFWRSDRKLHINIKELSAAAHTVRSLAKPGEIVHLSVDNSVSWSYLRRGGDSRI